MSEKLPRFIVLDIVFRGSSLNYNEGSGNYQELKKITLEDGKTYTMVSRYALRYSMLQTMKKLGYGNVMVPGDKLTKDTGKKGDKNVWQPDPNLLEDGSILLYPETDLFGFLITAEKNIQIQRESPVKVSHAVSLTPFEGDYQFAGNHSIAKRALEAGKIDKMDINLFTREEHETLYKYTVVIDTEEIGKLVFYTKNREKIKEGVHNGVTVKVEEEIEIPKAGKLYKVVIELSENIKKEHLKAVLEAIFNLTREIKGEPHDISPKLVVVSLWDGNYKTVYNRISLERQYTETVETEEKEENGKKLLVRRVRISEEPVVIISAPVEEKGDITKELVENILNGNLEKETFLLYKEKDVRVEIR